MKCETQEIDQNIDVDPVFLTDELKEKLEKVHDEVRYIDVGKDGICLITSDYVQKRFNVKYDYETNLIIDYWFG